MKPTVAIAFSGGIDSLMAGYLLKQEGYKVFGIHFTTGYESDENGEKISEMGRQIGVEIVSLDLRDEFQAIVVDYFSRIYMAGKTPNPCMVCNPKIKFGVVLERAKAMGASFLATGHYARLKPSESEGYRLIKGVDPEKEQSYFLAFLSQAQLLQAIFPLGALKKSEVKQLAKEKGLIPAIRSESQDVCFIREKTYPEFLADQDGFFREPGLIEDVSGKVIGRHEGLHRFTIGQRRGINCPASEPYYVIRLDVPRNCLVVGFREHLFAQGCIVNAVNWIQSPPLTPLHVHTRVRYRHEGASSMIYPVDSNTVKVRFEAPQAAITPGQAAVFYQNNEILGGGWIEGTDFHN